jgi:tetratricopeptide (TPR) repeat protein
MSAALGLEPVVAHFRALADATTPPAPLPQLWLAIALRAGDNVQESIALAKQLVTASAPDTQRANFMKFLALLLADGGQYEEACKLFEQVLRINPNDPTCLNNLAYALSERVNRPEEALPYARKALQLMPEESNILDTVGWTSHLAGRPPEEAIGYLLRAIRQNPRLVAAQYHLAEVYIARGDRAEAEQHLTRAFELSQEQKETEFHGLIESAFQKLGMSLPQTR